MTLNRRTFLTGALAMLAAPAIIRTPGLLMPVKRLYRTPVTDRMERILNAGGTIRGELLRPERPVNLLTRGGEILHCKIAPDFQTFVGDHIIRVKGVTPPVIFNAVHIDATGASDMPGFAADMFAAIRCEA